MSVWKPRANLSSANDGYAKRNVAPRGRPGPSDRAIVMWKFFREICLYKILFLAWPIDRAMRGIM